MPQYTLSLLSWRKVNWISYRFESYLGYHYFFFLTFLRERFRISLTLSGSTIVGDDTPDGSYTSTFCRLTSKISFSFILIFINKTMKLYELFDRTVPWNWTSKSDKRWEATFPTHDGETVVELISFGDIWEFSWEYRGPGEEEGTVAATGKGDEFLIISTVIDILRHFMQEVQPNTVVLSALKREPTRVKMFDRLWPKAFGRDWNIDRSERGAAVEYTLTRKQNETL